MRALYLCHQFWPYISGSSIFFEEMGRRLRGEGHEVTVFTSDALDFDLFASPAGRRIRPLRETYRGLRIRRFPVRHYPLQNHLSWRLARLPLPFAPYLFGTGFLPGLFLQTGRENRFDLVHGGLLPFGMFLYAAYRIAKRCGAPLIYSPFLHVGEPCDDRIRNVYSEPSQMELLRRADGLIVQTGIEKRHLEKMGCDPERILVLGMGLNPEDVTGGDGARFRKRYGIEGPIVFSVGIRARDKGTNHVVEAMKCLWKKGKNVHLVLAGPANRTFREYFREQPEEVKRRCLILESVLGDEKKDLFAAGDVFVLPSRNESFGMVYLEAWCCKKPVIGCFAGGVPEVIADGEDGFLVPFGNVPMLADYIWNLLEDKPLANRMGEKGRRKTIRNHTWERKYALLKGLYERILGDYAARRA